MSDNGNGWMMERLREIEQEERRRKLYYDAIDREIYLIKHGIRNCSVKGNKYTGELIFCCEDFVLNKRERKVLWAKGLSLEDVLTEEV